MFGWGDISHHEVRGVKEQVIEACRRDLSIHLQERSPHTLEELSRYTEQYLKARGQQLHQGWRSDQKGKLEAKTPNINRENKGWKWFGLLYLPKTTTCYQRLYKP